MSYLLGFVCGFVVGMFAMVLILGMCKSAGEADDAMEREQMKGGQG